MIKYHLLPTLLWSWDNGYVSRSQISPWCTSKARIWQNVNCKEILFRSADKHAGTSHPLSPFLTSVSFLMRNLKFKIAFGRQISLSAPQVISTVSQQRSTGMNSQPQNSRLWDVSRYLLRSSDPGARLRGSGDQRSTADVQPQAPAWKPRSPRNPSSRYRASPRSPSPGAASSLHPCPPQDPGAHSSRSALLTHPGHRTHGSAAESFPLPPRPRGARSQPGPLISSPAPTGTSGAPRLPGSRPFLLPAAAAGTGVSKDRSRRAPRPCPQTRSGRYLRIGAGERHLVSQVGPAKAGPGGELGTAVGAAAP